jgi:hypothetical protein
VGQWESLLTGIIDVPTWDKANWKAVLFMAFPDIAPAMGIFFTDEAAGKKIFQDLRAKFGQADTHNLIRVTIIEGSIPGKKPGYSVYVGPDFGNITAKATADGEDLTNKLTFSVGRYHRMNPLPGSPYLPRFKQEYKKHQHFALIPAFGAIEKPEPCLELAILKTQVHFRLVEDLTGNDVESVVLQK